MQHLLGIFNGHTNTVAQGVWSGYDREHAINRCSTSWKSKNLVKCLVALGFLILVFITKSSFLPAADEWGKDGLFQTVAFLSIADSVIACWGKIIQSEGKWHKITPDFVFEPHGDLFSSSRCCQKVTCRQGFQKPNHPDDCRCFVEADGVYYQLSVLSAISDQRCLTQREKKPCVKWRPLNLNGVNTAPVAQRLRWLN